MRSYAIGDVHGALAKLEAAHALIAADRAVTGDAGAPVVHVGDYVDRGPDVPGVLDLLGRGVARGEPWVLLKGNHDQLMLDFLRAPSGTDPSPADLHWLSANIGGRQTLAGYGIDVVAGRPPARILAEAQRVVPPSHTDLLASLKPFFRRGSVFFCHAGIRPGVPLDAQEEDDLLWIRGEFLNDTRDHGVLVVHGHTPVDAVTHHGNRVNLDTGAGYGGPVSVVVIEDEAVFRLTASGRVPVEPVQAA